MSPESASCGALTRDEVAQLRAAGVPVGEIADRAGVARATLYNAMSAWRIVGNRGGDHRSRYWRTLYREQLAAAIGGEA